jgi:hypothetical protein
MSIPRNFVVCDPLCSRSVLVLDAPTYQLNDEAAYLGAALVTVDGGADASTVSFEVILVTYFMFGPRLCVFSSRTGQWSVLPEANCGKSLMPMLRRVGEPAHANGCVYWVMDDVRERGLRLPPGARHAHQQVLHQHQAARQPACASHTMGTCMRVMRSEDGELRIAAMAWRSPALHVWRLDRTQEQEGQWTVGEGGGRGLVLVPGCVRLSSLQMAGEGAVFLKKFGSHCWVYLVNLEERTVLKLPHQRFSSGPALPYRMALSLLPCPSRPKVNFTSNTICLLRFSFGSSLSRLLCQKW